MQEQSCSDNAVRYASESSDRHAVLFDTISSPSNVTCALPPPPHMTTTIKQGKEYWFRCWLHVCDFMCDLLHIADAICCICDLVSAKNHFLSFFCTKSQMRFGVDAIWCLRFRVRFAVAQQIAQQIATRYRMLRVNGGISVSDT
jgi:hypothetical protein